MLANQIAFFNVESTKIFPKPFLKWAGGKSQLLGQLSRYFPKKFKRYAEPFTGSAAVYWHIFSLKEKGGIDFENARLTDSNKELVNAYTVLRDEIEQLIDKLKEHKKRHSKEHYYQVREWDLAQLTSLERAARFIYLNKTCYNGLYRVNRSGQFNVPMGSYKDPAIFDAEELLKASNALQAVEVSAVDFRQILAWAKKGDFIYFDPPYAPISKTSSFTSYTESPFGDIEQRELAEIYRVLDKRGCSLMLSNSWVESVAQLYQGFNLIEVKANRAINSNPEKRGKISELLVLNYEPPK